MSVDVPGLQEGTGKTLGSCAGQVPGGDGFDEPGTAARLVEQAAAQKAEAERLQREQEAKENEEHASSDAPL